MRNCEAVSRRDKARLLCTAEGNSSWLSAVPNGKKFAYLNRSQFTVAFKFWFGLPCQVARTCRCGRQMDIWGDHALTCKSGGGVVHRHNLILQTLVGFCFDAGMNPLKELSDYKINAKDRIGDLVLPREDHGRELLVDVTCWNPLYFPRLNMSSVIPLHTAKLAHKDKIEKRELDFQQYIQTQFGRVKYVPFACDIFGGWTSHCEDLIHRIAGELSVHRSIARSVCIQKIKSRLSMAIQKGVAVCLVIRNIDARLNLVDPEELFEVGLSDFLEDDSEFSDEEDGLYIDEEFDPD